MSSYSFKALTLGATLVLAAGGTWAQVTTPPVKPVTTVGVTPEDAKEATQKAVPAEDTGTLVRTEPSITDRAKEASKEAKEAKEQEKIRVAHEKAKAKAKKNNPLNKVAKTTMNTLTGDIGRKIARGLLGNIIDKF